MNANEILKFVVLAPENGGLKRFHSDVWYSIPQEWTSVEEDSDCDELEDRLTSSYTRDWDKPESTDEIDGINESRKQVQTKRKTTDKVI